MTKEDKNFFDGMLIGAITVAFVIAIFVGTAVYRYQPSNLPFIAYGKPAQTVHAQEKTEPQLVPAINTAKVGEFAKLDGKKHLVFAAYQSPNGQNVVRLMLNFTENNQQILSNALSKQSNISCITKNTIFVNQPTDYDGPVTISYWDKAGERLLDFDGKLIDSLLIDQFSCLQINSWADNTILKLTVAGKDQESTYQKQYRLNTETFKLFLINQAAE